MKKFLAIVTVIVIVASIAVFAACEQWRNPGDKLGGGGTGEKADEVDTSESDSVKDAVGDKSDLDDIAGDTSADGAKKMEPTSDVVEISKSGTYLFEGEYGGILLTKKELEVHLIFNGVTIKMSNRVAVDAQDKKDQSVTITLNEGTVNVVENDGVDENGEMLNAIHVKGSLVINGKGTLNVVSNSKSAIKVRDELKIVDATLNLTATNHALTALSVAAANCSINVLAAGKDGINVECNDETNEFTTDEGYVSLTNVNYTCNVEGDGIQADTVVYIDGGNYNITTTGKFVVDTADNRADYELVADDFKYIKSGSDFKRIASDERTSSTKYALAQGCKGIKVGEIEYSYKDDEGNKIEGTVYDGEYLIVIIGGTFNINSTDDSIHTNSGNVLIEGGTFTLATYDDAITSDVLTKITGGDINITTSYEGIEGGYVEISGANTTINLVAMDDGINAASDDKSITGHIIISGGNITVNASGDGIDSNGSILISGGTVIVHGPTTGRDAGLDADKGILVDGGTLFVTSTLGMVETPASNSKQYVVSYAHQSTITAGSVVSLRDKDGNILVSVEVLKNCQSIIISTPDMQKGSTYAIYGGDTQMVSFTISSIITTVGSSGSSFPGGPGGNPPSRPRR